MKELCPQLGFIGLRALEIFLARLINDKRKCRFKPQYRHKLKLINRTEPSILLTDKRQSTYGFALH